MKEKARAWLRRHHRLQLWASALFLAVGSALLTVTPFASVPLMAVGVGLGVLGEKLRDRDQEDRLQIAQRADSLEHQLSETSHALDDVARALREAIEDWLQAIGVWADLDSESRVTFYSLSGESWTRLARFSTNLSYMASGRTSLPVDQGALHQAHLVGEYFIDNLPSFETDAEAYFAEQRRLGVTKAISRQFNMRSRSYCCFAFGGDGDRTRPYAIVFESTDPNGLEIEALKLVVHTEARRAMVGLAKVIGLNTPSGR